MTETNSIKWRPTWKLWIPIVLFVLPLVLEGQLIGTSFTPYAYSILLMGYGIIYSIRTKLWQPALFAFVMAMTISVYFLSERPGMAFKSLELLGIYPDADCKSWITSSINMPIWFALLALMTFIFFTIGPVIVKAIEYETAAIRLFKLSARQVSGDQNGYTGRPYNAGRHSFTNDELSGFSLFLESKKICLPQYPDTGVKLLFSMGTSPLCKKYRDKISYVMFGDDGSLSVFISENDYKQYRKHYTFDQLCEKLGNTFLRFGNDYKAHHEKRIIAELKSV